MNKRIAVVTGAGTGIGHSTAKKLNEAGYQVFGIGRRLDVLQKNGEFFTPIAVDVRDKGSLTSALADIGPIHTLVANAGIARQARLEDAGCDDVWTETLSTNLDGTWNTLRAVHPSLVDNGRIVMVSSGLGKLGRPGFGAYCASKHGMLGLMKCIAQELAPRGITVNAVCPGWVVTEMALSDVEQFAQEQGRPFKDVEADIVANIPTGRFVTPIEVADLICWLASDPAGSITGQAYNISGGEFFA